MKEKIKLVMLIGCGRSGSTLIDRIVNRDEEILGVGELIKFNPSIYKEYCSCGDTVDTCSFWSQIISKIGWKEKEFQEFKKYQTMFEYSKRKDLFRVKDHSRHPDFDAYLSKNYEIFKAISLLSEGKIIFDSSKWPQRAFNLSKSDFFDVKVIFLMRDPRGVVWSMKKSFQKNLEAGLQKDMKGRSLLKSIYSWITVNSRSFSATKFTTTPKLFVKYEAFCEKPTNQIDRIIQFIFDGKSKKPIDLSATKTVASHTIAGNRLRMQKSIVITSDQDWKQNLTSFQQKFIYIFTLPWIKKFLTSLK